MTFHFVRPLVWAATIQVDPEDFAGIHHVSKISLFTPKLLDLRRELDNFPLDEIDEALAAADGLKVVFTIPESSQMEEGLAELRLEVWGTINRRMTGLLGAGKLSVEFSDDPGKTVSSYNTFFGKDT